MYHITKINLVIVHVYVQSTIVSPHKELGIVNKYIGHNFKFKEILLLNSADRLKFVRQITSNHHFSVQLHVQKTSKVKNPDSVFGVSLMCTVYHFWFSVDH